MSEDTRSQGMGHGGSGGCPLPLIPASIVIRPEVRYCQAAHSLSAKSPKRRNNGTPSDNGPDIHAPYEYVSGSAQPEFVMHRQTELLSLSNFVQTLLTPFPGRQFLLCLGSQPCLISSETYEQEFFISKNTLKSNSN